MENENIHTSYPEETSSRYIAPCLVNAIRDLTANDPEVRKGAIVSLKSAIESGIDISPVLPFLEKAIFDDDKKVRLQAVETLQLYALSMYKIDITAMLHELAGEEEETETEFFYPLTTHVVSTSLVPVAQTERGRDRGTSPMSRRS